MGIIFIGAFVVAAVLAILYGNFLTSAILTFVLCMFILDFLAARMKKLQDIYRNRLAKARYEKYKNYRWERI